MSYVDNELSKYLNQMEDQAIAGFIREVLFSLPDAQRRELIVKHLPEMKTLPEDPAPAPEEVHEEPVEFNIEVCRTGWGNRTIKVMAHSQSEAEELALDEAGNHEFSERDAEYTIV